MTGFITLHREATEHPLFKGDAQRFGAWVWLVAKACWKPTRYNVGGKTITLERGQFCASVRELADAWGMSKSAADRFLARLKTEAMIGTDTGTGRLVITISNYSKYQDIGGGAGTDGGTPTGTAAGQQRDIKEPGNQETSLVEEADASSTPRGDDRPPLSAFTIQPAANDDAEAEAARLAAEEAARLAAEKPAKKARKPKAPAPIDLPEWMPAAQWDGFIAMRQRKGAEPTPRAAELLIAKLERMRREGADPGAILDQSTMNNWTDLYPIKAPNRSERNDRQSSHYDDAPRNPLVRAAIRQTSGTAAGQGDPDRWP